MKPKTSSRRPDNNNVPDSFSWRLLEEESAKRRRCALRKVFRKQNFMSVLRNFVSDNNLTGLTTKGPSVVDETLGPQQQQQDEAQASSSSSISRSEQEESLIHLCVDDGDDGNRQNMVEHIIDDFENQLMNLSEEPRDTFLSSFIRQENADEVATRFVDPDPVWRKEQIVKVLGAFSAKARLPVRNRRLLIKLFRVICVLFNLTGLSDCYVPSATQLEGQIEDMLTSYKQRLSLYCSGCLNKLSPGRKKPCETPGCTLANATRRLIGKEKKIAISTLGIKPQIESLVRRKHEKIKKNLESISAARQSGIWTDVIHSPAYEQFVGANPQTIAGEQVFTISLILSWDGLPIGIFTGSGAVWPITAIVTELQHGERCLPQNLLYLGTYTGPNEPTGIVMKLCMERAVKELLKLQHPFKVKISEDESVKIRVKIFCVTVDTPARAELFMFCHHNARHACFKCFDLGIRYAGRTVWLPVTNADRLRLRKTGDQFKMLADVAHSRYGFQWSGADDSVCGVTGRSPLLDVCSTEQVLTDAFHLLKEGLLKKILAMQVGGPHNTPGADWDIRDYKGVVQKIVSRTSLPTGFRIINDPFVPSKFSGEMYFVLFVSSWPVVLSQCHNGTADVCWFVYLVIMIVRLMVEPQMVQADIDVIRKLLDLFAWSALKILGPENLCLNVHNTSTHLSEQIERFLFLFDLDTSVFETHIGLIKRTSTFGNQDQVSTCFTRRGIQLITVAGLTFDGTPFADQEDIQSFMQALQRSGRSPYLFQQRSNIPLPGRLLNRVSNWTETEKENLSNRGFSVDTLLFFENFSFQGHTYASHVDYSCGGNTSTWSAISYNKTSSQNHLKHFGIINRIFRAQNNSEVFCSVSRLRAVSPIWKLFSRPPECREMIEFKEALESMKSFWFKVEVLDSSEVISASKVLGPVALCGTEAGYFVADMAMRYVHN